MKTTGCVWMFFLGLCLIVTFLILMTALCGCSSCPRDIPPYLRRTPAQVTQDNKELEIDLAMWELECGPWKDTKGDK